MPFAGRRGKDDSNIVPFRTTRLVAFTHLFSNVMRSKRFLSHLILTLSWCLRNNIRSWWEKFASSYNAFFRVVQITILATARIARNTTRFSPSNGGRTLSRTNQRQATRAALVRCKPSTPRRDPRKDELAGRSRRRAQPFFQTTAAANTIGHVCQAHSEAQAEKGQCVYCKPPGERELGIVQESRTWSPIPMGANLLRRPAAPLTERVRSGSHY